MKKKNILIASIIYCYLEMSKQINSFNKDYKPKSNDTRISPLTLKLTKPNSTTPSHKFTTKDINKVVSGRITKPNGVSKKGCNSSPAQGTEIDLSSIDISSCIKKGRIVLPAKKIVREQLFKPITSNLQVIQNKYALYSRRASVAISFPDHEMDLMLKAKEYNSSQKNSSEPMSDVKVNISECPVQVRNLRDYLDSNNNGIVLASDKVCCCSSKQVKKEVYTTEIEKNIKNSVFKRVVSATNLICSICQKYTEKVMEIQEVFKVNPLRTYGFLQNNNYLVSGTMSAVIPIEQVTNRPVFVDYANWFHSYTGMYDNYSKKLPDCTTIIAIRERIYKTCYGNFAKPLDDAKNSLIALGSSSSDEHEKEVDDLTLVIIYYLWINVESARNMLSKLIPTTFADNNPAILSKDFYRDFLTKHFSKNYTITINVRRNALREDEQKFNVNAEIKEKNIIMTFKLMNKDATIEEDIISVPSNDICKAIDYSYLFRTKMFENMTTTPIYLNENQRIFL